MHHLQNTPQGSLLERLDDTEERRRVEAAAEAAWRGARVAGGEVLADTILRSTLAARQVNALPACA